MKGWQTMLDGLVWVLVVIACWATLATIAFLLIRFVARENDNEQLICELTPDYFADRPATT